MSTGNLSTEESSYIEVTWKIDDFLNKPATVDFVLVSKSFSFAKASWQLGLLPNGSTADDSEDYIDVHITRLNSTILAHSLHVLFLIKTSDGEEYNSFSEKCHVDTDNPTRGFLAYLLRSKIVTHKDLLLSNGTLTVCCQVRANALSQNESPEPCVPLLQIGGVASSEKPQDASSHDETLDFNTQNILPETSSNIFPDCNRMLAGDLLTETSSYVVVTWEIDDFERKLDSESSLLESKSFSFAKADWQLEIRAIDDDDDDHDYDDHDYDDNDYDYDDNDYDYDEDDDEFHFNYNFDVHLTRLNSSILCHPLSIKSFCKTSFAEKYRSSRNKCIFDHFDQSYRVFKYYFQAFKLIFYRGFLLPKGTLTVCCQIRMSKNESSESISLQQQVRGGAPPMKQNDAHSQIESIDLSIPSEVLPVTPASFHKLQSDYKKLLESEEDTDVCLKVSDQEFRAHKCILRARSTVFSAMFKHDTEEKASGEVVIEDLDPESFPVFLQHIYDGSTDALAEENVFNLYTASDKYDMRDLKSECKNFMVKTLSVDTFCDVMILTLRYQEDELLKLAIDFFCKNLAKIIVTVKWQNFSKEYNTAANELFIKALVPADEN